MSNTQANILIPSGLAAGTAKITVLHGSTALLKGSVTVGSSAPGLYSMNSDGAGVAAADAFLAPVSGPRQTETVFACNPPALRSCLGTPLNLGGTGDALYVELYGTGIRGASTIQTFVAGQTVPTYYAGPVAAYPGLDQVNIAIPQSLAGSGDVRVYVVVDGVASNAVGLTLQ
ncbi:MAG TPA: hypothetical protein VKG79_14710 [Bryobacteraceae bacterium]|nr:hypothetical protein [Bryobacteraceae bacterium]